MWAFSLILAKLGIYASLLGCIGAVFCLWFFGTEKAALFRRIGKHGVGCSLWAIFLCPLGFLLQVGMTSQSGILGVFNGPILDFLWQAQVGDSLRYRLLGSLLALGGFWLYLRNLSGSLGFAGASFLVVAIVLICSSFFTAGHTQSLGWIAKLAIAAHLFCLGCWIGSLLPLYWSLTELPPASLATSLVKFGDLAIWLVVILSLAGGYLIVELLGSPLQLFSSTYGGGILLKLSLVAVLLLLAARNRYSLVPKISSMDKSDENSIDQFRVTLIFELIFAFLIILVTAAVTSLSGPSH